MHLRKWMISSCTTFALLGLASAHASATQIFNAAGDFSETNNPNGAWSYGYRTAAASSSLTDYTTNGTFQNVEFWYLSGSGLPDVGYNPTSTVQGGFLPPGDLYFHPGDNAATADDLSVVRWTAPSAGTYQLTTLFTGIDTRVSDDLVYVVNNGATDFSGIVSGVGAAQSYDTTYNLAAGDTVDFAVGNNGSVGDHNFVQLDATIVNDTNNSPAPEVPETGTLTLCVLGLGVLLLRARRRA